MIIISFCLLFSSIESSAAMNTVTTTNNGIEYVDRLIVKMRAPQGVQTAGSTVTVMNSNQMATISGMVGVQMAYMRPMAGQAHVLKLPSRMPIDQAMVLANSLANNPSVEYAEPDRMLHPMRVPNDPRYIDQWHFDVSANHGMNLPGAWDISIGSANVVTAVIDTGILPNHADFAAARILPGFDMIFDPFTANDGVAIAAVSGDRDADPTDTGDAVLAGDCGVGSAASPSSWHGTHVSGTIGAATNNGIGVAGVDWTGKILPVRALGKCGGLTSDIIDAMAWAAGIPVAGVPNNPNPANVLNLSLGGTGACSTAEQTIITQIVGLGKVVVVAAGNAAANTSTVNPASCIGVIAVAAHGPASTIAPYSNRGAEVAVMAPGGDQSLATADGVLSTLDGGTTTALNDNAFVFYQGTSMASPHVAGLVALMLAVNPGLTPAQVKTTLQNSARPFVPAGFCATRPNSCGTGIVDAQTTLAAVNTAIPPAAPTTLSATVLSASQINLVWTDNANNETGFNIEHSTDGGITFTPLATTAANISSFANTGLAASTTFHYRVRAFNNFTNSAFSATANATTLAPPVVASGGGGCSIATTERTRTIDPLLPMLLVLSLFWLFRSRRDIH